MGPGTAPALGDFPRDPQRLQCSFHSAQPSACECPRPPPDPCSQHQPRAWHRGPQFSPSSCGQLPLFLLPCHGPSAPCHPGLWPQGLSSLPSRAARGPCPQARSLPFHSPLHPGPLCTFSDWLWEQWGQPLPASGSAPTPGSALPPPGGVVALEFQPFSGSQEKEVPGTGWGGGGNIRVHRHQASCNVRIPALTPVTHP